MSQSLSEGLCERVLDAVADGALCRAAAVRFGVALLTAICWVKRFQETGDRKALPQGGDYRSQAIEVHADFILTFVEARKDVTLAEIVERLKTEKAFACAQSTVWRFFSRRGITFKKDSACQQQQRLDVLKRRHAWV